MENLPYIPCSNNDVMYYCTNLRILCSAFCNCLISIYVLRMCSTHSYILYNYVDAGGTSGGVLLLCGGGTGTVTVVIIIFFIKKKKQKDQRQHVCMNADTIQAHTHTQTEMKTCTLLYVIQRYPHNTRHGHTHSV